MTQATTSRRRINLRNWSIRRKMLGGLLLSALIPLGLFFAVESISRYISAVTDTQAALEQSVKFGATILERDLQNAVTEVSTASDEPLMYSQTISFARTVTDDPNATVSGSMESQLYGTMQTQLAQHPRFRAIRLIAPDGRLLIQVGDVPDLLSITDANQSTHPTFLQIIDPGLAENTGNLLRPVEDTTTGNLLLEIGVPVFTGRLMGYLVYTVNTEQLLERPLTEVLDESTNERIASAAYMFIVDRDGWLLTSAQGKSPFSTQINVADIRVSQTADVVGYRRNWDGDAFSVTGRYTRLEEYDWTLVAEIPLNAIVWPLMAALLSSVLPPFILTVVLTALTMFVINQQLIAPITRLTQAATEIAAGDLSKEVATTEDRDEIGQLTNAVATMTDHMRLSIETLEQRVLARTRDLELTTVIGRQAAATLQDIDALLNQTINLIVDNFPQIYHAQVFLIDNANEFAVLKASTGQPGVELLKRGHRLAVGSISVIGRVTELGRTVIARDTATSRFHHKNEFLLATRAEMALPLIRGGKILGALDVQSKSADAFTPEEQAIFEALSAQLAIALDNARLFNEMSNRASEVESLNQLLTRTSWQRTLSSARRRGQISVEAADGSASFSNREEWSPWQHQAAAQRDVVISQTQDDGLNRLAVPIVARGEVLGVIEWRLKPQAITDNTTQLARELTERLAITLETIRLLERSEQMAERERLVNRISNRLSVEPDVSFILQTAVEELATVLETPAVNIRLGKGNGKPESGPAEDAE